MRASVPSLPLRGLDDMVVSLAELKADAASRGFRTLAYFLEMAVMEAQTQAVVVDKWFIGECSTWRANSDDRRAA